MKQLDLDQYKAVAPVIGEVDALVGQPVTLDELENLRKRHGELSRKIEWLDREKETAPNWPASNRRWLSQQLIAAMNDRDALARGIEELEALR